MDYKKLMPEAANRTGLSGTAEIMRSSTSAAIKPDDGMHLIFWENAFDKHMRAILYYDHTIASGNTILLRILSMCVDMVNSSLATANRHANVNVLASKHMDMYEAIKKKDVKTAERLMRDYIGRACDRTKFIAEQIKKNH